MINKQIKLLKMDPEHVADEIGDFIIDKVHYFGSSGAVVGLSGGVDSTTTAAIAKRIFDMYNKFNPENQLELVGYCLPSKTNAKEDAEDGIKVAEQLGIRYEVLEIEPIVEAYKNTNPEAFDKNYHKGNMMSRIRANILNTKSATENKTLLGTGNRDEDFGIGYYTVFGDGAVHVSPIGALPKRIVREVASYLGFTELSIREPTAGLEPGQTDFKDLGYSYDLVELISEGYLQKFSEDEMLEHPQIKNQVTQDIGEYQRRFGNSKFENLEDAIKDVFHRHEIAKRKFGLVSPEVAEISLKY